MAAHDFLPKLRVRSQVLHCQRLPTDGAHLIGERKQRSRRGKFVRKTMRGREMRKPSKRDLVLRSLLRVDL